MCGVTASWCVAAPGVGIYSTIPASKRFPDGYAHLSGTSMATPMVSGALALLTQAYPAYNSQDLAHVLFATAENLGARRRTTTPPMVTAWRTMPFTAME